jgi:dihydroflavonol-4-reductase
MKVFITGSNGFLGSNLIRELLKRNYEIIAFVKYGESTKNIDGLDIKLRFGDILDINSLIKSMLGCEIVIHTAASTSLWPYRSEFQKQINIEGTKNVVAAAKNINIKKFIHIGTANSFGFGTKENPGDETKPYTAGKYKLDYMDTKYKAQQYILNEVRENNFPAVIINPTFMFGPFGNIEGSAQMVERIYNKKFPGYTKGGRNYVSVKDVVIAIANAIEKGKIGECYIAGNENLNYKEITELIAKVVGVKAPSIYFPSYLVKIYTIIITITAIIFRFKPSINYRMGLMSLDEHYYSSTKAVKELNMPQSALKEAIIETFEWLKNEKIIN